MKRPGNILVITSWSYKDALIQAYTLPYLQLFNEIIPSNKWIYLVTLEQPQFKLNKNERSQVKERLRLQGIRWIDFNYYKFGISSLIWIFFFIRLFILAITRRISHIHGWCTPAGSVAYLVSLFTGKPLIIDSYEPHAEVMLETNTWSRNSFQFKALFAFERLQGKRASKLICCVKEMKEYAKTKFHFDIKDVIDKPACVDLTKFSLKNRKNPYLVKKLGLENKIVCVYAGKFGGLYLEQEVFDFLKVAYDKWKDDFRVLLLTSTSDEKIQYWCTKAGLPFHVIKKTFCFHDEVPDYIGLGDFGISPYNPVPSRRYSAPIKNAEYWALGLPVIITNNIANDSDIIAQNLIGSVIRELNVENYKRSVEEMSDLLRNQTMEEMYYKIRAIAEKQRHFGVALKVYKEVYGV